MKNTNEKLGGDAASKGGLHGDKRGAVLAEFVIVLMPLLTTFFVFMQLSAMTAAKLMVKHATIVGVRAATVFSNKNENVPEQKGEGRGEVVMGVNYALGSWRNEFTSVSVVINDSSNRGDVYGLVTVSVTATYKCQVPLGKIICGGTGTKIIRDTQSMAHQGARYKK